MLERSVGTIIGKTGRSDEEAREALAGLNADGRIVEPEEVAAMVLELCDPGSDAVTGQALAIPELTGKAAHA